MRMLPSPTCMFSTYRGALEYLNLDMANFHLDVLWMLDPFFSDFSSKIEFECRELIPP